MSMQRNVLLALAALALMPAAARAQGQLTFLHLPSSTAPGAPTIVELVVTLQGIGGDLQSQWQAAHPGQTPKVCWAGYSGSFVAGGTSRYDFGGDAANRLGHASASDNQEGYSVPIEDVATREIVTELLARCDLVLEMGEEPNSMVVVVERR
ncbi:MAG TPA: hypothetical protein VMW27_02650 [Thermoanaerobaculia bacterium]|nr:hypothetical protein [Thermoanaerobaculia bacterium]